MPKTLPKGFRVRESLVHTIRRSGEVGHARARILTVESSNGLPLLEHRIGSDEIRIIDPRRFSPDVYLEGAKNLERLRRALNWIHAEGRAGGGKRHC